MHQLRVTLHLAGAAANPSEGIPSEGIIESGENRGTVAAVTNVDITHHEGSRDAPKTHPGDRMQVIQRIGAGTRKDPAEINERRDLNIELGRDRIEGKHLSA